MPPFYLGNNSIFEEPSYRTISGNRPGSSGTSTKSTKVWPFRSTFQEFRTFRELLKRPVGFDGRQVNNLGMKRCGPQNLYQVRSISLKSHCIDSAHLVHIIMLYRPLSCSSSSQLVSETYVKIVASRQQ